MGLLKEQVKWMLYDCWDSPPGCPDSVRKPQFIEDLLKNPFGDYGPAVTLNMLDHILLHIPGTDAQLEAAGRTLVVAGGATLVVVTAGTAVYIYAPAAYGELVLVGTTTAAGLETLRPALEPLLTR